MQFQLYQRYSRKDVCRILGWPESDAYTIFGYRIKDGVCPIFVTYHKDVSISESVRYADHFINRNQLSWMSKSRRRLDSPEIVKLRNYQSDKLKILLFVQNNKREKDFCYLGEMTPTDFTQEWMRDDYNKTIPVVNVKFELQNQVPELVYDILVK